MSLFVEPRQSPTSGGNNYAGAKYYFYLSGTTTPAAIYTDADRTTQHANPVIADSGGVFAPIWLDPLLMYRRVLKTSAGASISDVDPYPGSNITQDELWELLGEETEAELAIGAVIVNPQYPEGNMLRYGDDAIALQTAINVVAVAGYGDVVVPRGAYSISGDIYFHYDATSNPDFPSGSGLGGMINIVGEGWQDYTNHVNGTDQGSILNIGSGQFKIGNGTQATRGVRFRNCTVKGNSTTYLVKYDTASRGCGFSDFTLFQDGVGGGIEMDDTFLNVIDNAFAASTNASTAGIGWYIHNSSVAAGNYDLRQVTGKDFLKNIVLGEEGTGASSMSNIVLNACQGIGGDYNLILGNGAKSVIIDAFHNEGPGVTGVVVAYGARHIRFEALYNSAAGASADYMSLGLNTGTDATDYCADVSVLNGTFVDISNKGIRVYTSASVLNREIAFCSFTGVAGTETAIDLENAAQHGLIIGPNIYTTVAVEVSNPTRVDVLRAGDTLGAITYQSPIALTGGVTGKVLFGDEIEIDGAFNHDGTTFGALNKTPATQATHIADVSGGAVQDAESRTAIAAILDVLERFGFAATS